jgi:hypothetical protein
MSIAVNVRHGGESSHPEKGFVDALVRNWLPSAIVWKWMRGFRWWTAVCLKREARQQAQGIEGVILIIFSSRGRSRRSRAPAGSLPDKCNRDGCAATLGQV